MILILFGLLVALLALRLVAGAAKLLAIAVVFGGIAIAALLAFSFSAHLFNATLLSAHHAIAVGRKDGEDLRLSAIAWAAVASLAVVVASHLLAFGRALVRRMEPALAPARLYFATLTLRRRRQPITASTLAQTARVDRDVALSWIARRPSRMPAL